jgi:hypothetical protein
MMVLQNTSEAQFSSAISLHDLVLDLAVSSHRGWALRRRILSTDVLGYMQEKNDHKCLTRQSDVQYEYLQLQDNSISTYQITNRGTSIR